MILKNRTLRFTRLDQVDDPEESNFVSNGVNLGPYTFVSCWTECKEESIPMWKMYTRGEWGVRMSLERDGLFQTYKDYTYKRQGAEITEVGEEILFLFDPELKWSQTDFMPPFLTDNYEKCNFYRKVEYVDDITPYANNSVKNLSQQDEKMSITIDFDKVGSYKNKRWAFQEESRFVMFLLPGNPFASLNSPNHYQEQRRIIKDIINNKELGFSHYDMPLSAEAFDHLVITMSPLCSSAQRVIVESLCEKYAPKAKIVESLLIGKLAR